MSTRRSAPAPSRHANKIPQLRLLGLAPHDAILLREAGQLIDAGKLPAAEVTLLRVMIHAADHPETLRWLGSLQSRRDQPREAEASFRRSLAIRPDDAVVMCLLAATQAALGDDAAALTTLRTATTHADDAQTWLQLGLEFDRHGHAQDALIAAEHTLALAPQTGQARLLRARCLHGLGRAQEAAAEYRQLIARKQHIARAWYALMDMKTVRIDAAELTALERDERSAATSTEDRILLAYALGKASEDAGKYPEAFAALERANALARTARQWNPHAFSASVDAVRAAFEHHTTVSSDAQGSEVIFVVGLPRSSTTLFEQVLAAHPQVEGASELPALEQVIAEESSLRRQPFPQWVAAASAEDWARMGRSYLKRTARWRVDRPISTDKMPANWLFAGAALAMLPGAKFIGCWRDPIETLWSCYKQLFAPGLADFACDFTSMAAYWHDFDRLGAFWIERYPQQFRAQRYEDLIANPEAEIRDLLDFCGLPFEAACLRFHEAQRNVRTPSASQVRQPIRRDTARTASYGALLDPLRALLAPPTASSESA